MSFDLFSLLQAHLFKPTENNPLNNNSLSNREWWDLCIKINDSDSSPLIQAILGGLYSTNYSQAFLGGYQAAIRHLLILKGHKSASVDCFRCFCVSESRGRHPRDLQCKLNLEENGSQYLEGDKNFISEKDLVQELLILAREPSEKLRLVRLKLGQNGMDLKAGKTPKFVPDINRGEIMLNHVYINEADVFPGDGHQDYSKVFGHLEGQFVRISTLGFILKHIYPEKNETELIEQIISIIYTYVTVLESHGAKPNGQILLAGLKPNLQAIVRKIDALLKGKEIEKRPFALDWQRDQIILFADVPFQEVRKHKAWELLMTK